MIQLKTRRIGNCIVEITIETPETTLTFDVCNLLGIADVEFIESLKNAAQELKEHNEIVMELNKQ